MKKLSLSVLGLTLHSAHAAAQIEPRGWVDMGVKIGPALHLSSEGTALPDGVSTGVNLLFRPSNHFMFGAFYDLSYTVNESVRRTGEIVDANASLVQHFWGLQLRVVPAILEGDIWPYLNLQLGRAEVSMEHEGSQCSFPEPSFAGQVGVGADVRLSPLVAVGFGVDAGVLPRGLMGCTLEDDPNELLPQEWPAMLLARVGISHSF